MTCHPFFSQKFHVPPPPPLSAYYFGMASPLNLCESSNPTSPLICYNIKALVYTKVRKPVISIKINEISPIQLISQLSLVCPSINAMASGLYCKL